MKQQSTSTLIGSGALILWAIEPLLVSEISGIPLFEALFIIFASCFILTASRVTIAGKWQQIIKQPLFVWCFGVITICGSDFCYMLGANCAPIAHVDLIDYLWPCLLVVFISFTPNEKFSKAKLIGAFLGLLGVCQLCFSQERLTSEYLLGYSIALYGVVIWGLYSLYSKRNLHVPTDMVGIYCGIGAIVALIFHLSCETTVIPATNQLTMAVILGLAGPGLAYQLWDYGIKYGDASFLSVCCYISRVTAVVLLVYFGKEPFSTELVIACALASLGVFICGLDKLTITKCWKVCKKPFVMFSNPMSIE